MFRPSGHCGPRFRVLGWICAAACFAQAAGCGGPAPPSSGSNPFAENAPSNTAPPVPAAPRTPIATPPAAPRTNPPKVQPVAQDTDSGTGSKPATNNAVAVVDQQPTPKPSGRAANNRIAPPASPPAITADPLAGWPQFRGPSSDGISTATNVPVEWSDNANIRWKQELPGAGASSPIVIGDYVLVTYFRQNVPPESAGDEPEMSEDEPESAVEPVKPPAAGGNIPIINRENKGDRGRGMRNNAPRNNANNQPEARTARNRNPLQPRNAGGGNRNTGNARNRRPALERANRGGSQALVCYIACFDRSTGNPIWEEEVSITAKQPPLSGFLAKHGYSSSTLTTDGHNLIAFLGTSGVHRFDLGGNSHWSKSVGAKTDEWGSGTSPLLFENLVIVNACVEGGAVIALDRETGGTVWTAPGVKRSWSTPCLVTLENGEQEVVVSGENKLFGLDPRKGRKLWECDGITDYVCPSVISADGIAYAIGGRAGRAIAVRGGGEGDVTTTHVVWNVAAGSNVPSPVLVDKKLFWLDEDGLAHCLDASTGEILKKQRTDAGETYASVVAAEGRLYAVSRQNGTIVLSADANLKELAHNQIDSDNSTFNGSPAILDGEIYLRSDKYLYCIAN